MNVYIITSLYPYDPHIGGVQTHSYYLHRYLKKLGYNVFVFTTSNKNYNDYQNKIFQFKLKNLSDAINISNKIVRIVEKFGPGILHFHFNRELSIIAYLVKSLLQIPLIISYHDDPYIDKNEPITNPIIKNFLLDTFKKAEAIIVHSKYVLDGMKKSFNISDDRIFQIPLGVDTQLFKKHTISDRIFNFIKDEYINVLCPARYTLQKGLVPLVRNISKIKNNLTDYHFILFGEGHLENTLRFEINKLDLNKIVSLVRSNLPFNLTPILYNSADIIILPSLFEPAGMVLLEAMACEVPVIASNVGGIPEIVEHMKTGYLFNPTDYEKLKEYLYTLRDESIRKILGKNGRERVIKYFDINKTINKIINVYEAITGGEKL